VAEAVAATSGKVRGTGRSRARVHARCSCGRRMGAGVNLVAADRCGFGRAWAPLPGSSMVGAETGTCRDGGASWRRVPGCRRRGRGRRGSLAIVRAAPSFRETGAMVGTPSKVEPTMRPALRASWGGRVEGSVAELVGRRTRSV
jgi:hypothetical protein